MALASERSIPYFERAFFPEEAAEVEEAFTTGTLMEVMPLVQINGQPVGAGIPGEVTCVLIAAYRELVMGHSLAKPQPKDQAQRHKVNRSGFDRSPKGKRCQKTRSCRLVV